MTRVILADDHPLFLSALELSLEAAGVEVVGTSGTGDEVLSLVEKWRPDAVLLDLAMPGMDGLTCVTRLAEKHPDVRVVVVSATDDPNAIREVLTAGAVCFVGKSVQPSDLVHALRAVTKTDGIHYRGELPAAELDRPVRVAAQEGHGEDAVGDRADGQVPPLEHLPEAGSAEPHGGVGEGEQPRTARAHRRGRHSSLDVDRRSRLGQLHRLRAHASRSSGSFVRG